MSHILIHIPHSSKKIPAKYREQFSLSDFELADELLKMTDHYVDDLFDIPGCIFQYNSMSRLVMDPERFRDDKEELMSREGMGLAYTKTSAGKTLRNLTDLEREDIVRSLYDPYHEEFTGKVDAILSRYNKCLIIDAHSFPSKPLPYEHKSESESNRADICLGYSDYHAGSDLIKAVEEYFSLRLGLSVTHNDPFSGSIVPFKYYLSDKRVQSLMIEINRALYMDESTGQKLPEFAKVHEMIRGLFDKIQQ